MIDRIGEAWRNPACWCKMGWHAIAIIDAIMNAMAIKYAMVNAIIDAIMNVTVNATVNVKKEDNEEWNMMIVMQP